MINGEKLPYEEYVLDVRKMALLNTNEQAVVANLINKKIEKIKIEKNISYDAAKCILLEKYKRMRDENMLPKYYIVQTDPAYFEKLYHFSEMGIRDVAVLTEEEFDRRTSFTLNYIDSGEVI